MLWNGLTTIAIITSKSKWKVCMMQHRFFIMRCEDQEKCNWNGSKAMSKTTPFTFSSWIIDHFPIYLCRKGKSLTCSGFRPGGTHVYSSRGHPLSSSDVELRLASWWISRVRLLWSVSGPVVISWAFGGHLQCLHIFLQRHKLNKTLFFVTHWNNCWTI